MDQREGVSIAHVYNYLSPQAGGPPQVIAHLSEALAQRGHRSVLIAHDAHESPAETLLREVWGERSLPDRLSVPNRAFFLSPSRELRRVIQRVDLVHLHSVWPPQCALVSRVCVALGVPYILSLHGHLRAEALQIKAWKKALGLRFGYQAMMERASAYHALNESEREDIRRFGLQGPIEVIPNGVRLTSEVKSGRAQLPTPLRSALGDDPYLLFLSRVHPPKGAKDLAVAFAQLADQHPRVHLVVAGADEAGGVAEVREVAERAGLTERVHLPGYIGGEPKVALLQSATLFCLPSYHEGFSVAILEAMASGTPVLISEGCHFPVVEREALGWTHACGSEPLLACLREALTSAEERQRRAERGRRWVEAHATWPQLAYRYERLYAQHIIEK